MPDAKKLSENEEVSKNESESTVKVCDERIRFTLELRILLKEDNKLKYINCDDTYLDRFLAAENYVVEEAFKKIKLFYEVLEENPSWYTKQSPDDKKWIIDKDSRLVLKGRDKEGRPIYVIKLAKMDVSTMNFLEDVVPMEDFYMEAMFLEKMGLENGLCVIIDIADFPIKITKWATPHNVKTSIKRIYSMPIKDIRYHVVNRSKWLNIFLKLMWPFLPSLVKIQVNFHLSDFEALHQHIDKDVLPEEYGGLQKITPNELQLLVLELNLQEFPEDICKSMVAVLNADRSEKKANHFNIFGHEKIVQENNTGKTNDEWIEYNLYS